MFQDIPYDSMAFDACLIQTDPIDFGRFGQKIGRATLTLEEHVPAIGLGNEPVSREYCTIAGWGVTENGVQSPVLLWTDVKVTTTAYCNSLGSRDRRFENFHPNYFICAGTGRNDTCKGDSGGPLFCSVGNRNVLAGITSRGTVHSEPI